MNCLLDTHMLIWLRLSPEKLRPDQLAIIQAPETEKFVSAISAWEISLKFSIGKLDLGGHKPDEFISGLLSLGLKNITPTAEQYSTYYLLPAIKNHKDPFDRMIIWHAMQSGLALLSNDAQFSQYKPHGLQLA